MTWEPCRQTWSVKPGILEFGISVSPTFLRQLRNGWAFWVTTCWSYQKIKLLKKWITRWINLCPETVVVRGCVIFCYGWIIKDVQFSIQYRVIWKYMFVIVSKLDTYDETSIMFRSIFCNFLFKAKFSGFSLSCTYLTIHTGLAYMCLRNSYILCTGDQHYIP